MNNAVRVLDDIDNIFHSNHSTIEKFALFRVLLVLSLKFALGRPKGTGTTRVLGFQLEFVNYASFLFLFEEIFVKLAYKFESQSTSPLILDCGSNIGISVAYFKRLYPNSRIIAFEPDPESFAILKRNVERNSMSGVTLYNRALYDRRGPIDFYRDTKDIASGIDSTILERVSNAQRIQVEADLLSGFVSEEVDFLKLDVEGAEERVIDELVAHGKMSLIREMIVEYHHHIHRGRDNLSHTLAVLERSGFGYQLQARSSSVKDGYQDVLILAYRKGT